MSPDEAAFLLRTLIGTDVDREVDGEILARIAERAADGADGPGRDVLLRYAQTYRAGRLVNWSAFAATLLNEGETAALVRDVESAFASSKENDHDR